jgi:hypothetical protein
MFLSLSSLLFNQLAPAVALNGEIKKIVTTRVEEGEM